MTLEIESSFIRCNGSAALDLYHVACGRINGFWELKLRLRREEH